MALPRVVGGGRVTTDTLLRMFYHQDPIVEIYSLVKKNFLVTNINPGYTYLRAVPNVYVVLNLLFELLLYVIINSYIIFSLVCYKMVSLKL